MEQDRAGPCCPVLNHLCSWVPGSASPPRNDGGGVVLRGSWRQRRDPSRLHVENIGPPRKLGEQRLIGPRHPDLALQGFECPEQARAPARIEVRRYLVEQHERAQ